MLRQPTSRNFYDKGTVAFRIFKGRGIFFPTEIYFNDIPINRKIAAFLESTGQYPSPPPAPTQYFLLKKML